MIYETMVRFLYFNFPIQKIKVDGRFKRCVIIHSNTYSISNNEDLRNCSYELINVLFKVFAYNDNKTMIEAIAYHLGLK